MTHGGFARGEPVTSDFSHVTVLREEAVRALNPVSGGLYVDATLGGAGHTDLLLKTSAPAGLVVAFDQDAEAIRHARDRYHGTPESARLTLVHDNFRRMRARLDELGIAGVDGLVCDLGVSSPQLDREERGFSYQLDAALDMRMNREARFSAADLVNTADEAELVRILREYGEEKWAARIASFIVRERARTRIVSTGQLVDLVKAAIPAAARRTGPHPAKRTFQALRIAVNDELGALRDLLDQLPQVLSRGGRVACITFHSLEDRLVKRTFQEMTRDCVCPPGMPRCVCGGHRASLRLVTRKPLTPGDIELSANPRARSAKLRVAERL